MSNTGYSDYWYARQAGEKPPFYDGKPQPGLYQIMKGGDPVRIVEVEGAVVVLVNEVESASPNKVWLACGRNDVSFEAYEERISTGKWPGDIKSRGIGDNAPPEDPIELLPLEVEKAKEWLAKIGDFKSDLQAHEAANRADAISKLRVKVEKVHSDEKEPFLKAGKEVDDKYLPKVKDGKAVYALLKAAIGKYDVAKRLAAQKAAAEHAAKVEAEKRAADATRNKGEQPPIPVSPPAPPEPPPLASYGNLGRKVSVKAKPLAKITDQYAVYQFFKDDPEVVNLLQKLAQRAVDSDIIPAGVEKVEGVTAR